MLLVCLIVLLFPRMDFHMPLRASHVVVCSSPPARSLLCQGVLPLHSRAGVASRADGPGLPGGLLVPISGYRVPSLKLIATPHSTVPWVSQPAGQPKHPSRDR